MDLGQLLQLGVKQKASDLHLAAGLPPMARIDGELVVLTGYSAARFGSRQSADL